MTLEIQILPYDRYKDVAGLNRLMGFPTPLLITGSLAIHIYTNDKKPAQIYEMQNRSNL